MSGWTATEAAAATGGRVAGDWTATGLGIDTRTLRPGEMFVALTAARDGHDFVAQALDGGAGAALVSRVPEGVDPARLLVVDDVQAALDALGRAGRARARARVAAVTGSVGKTSTKEMLAAMLRPQGATHAAAASFNNHWGVPLTLAAIPRDAAFAVVEIGMNHPGEIAPLAALARPDAALVTNVGPVHLEAFADGVAGIAAEKAAIFTGLAQGGAAIWPAATPAPPGARPTSTFGTEEGADWRLLEVVGLPDAVTCAARTPLGPLAFRIGAPGAHFALNALGALAIVHALGADAARAAMALSDWTPPAGRGRRHAVRLGPDAAPVDLIDDAYNANPTSVGAALDLLASVDVPRRARRIAILGDMRELGPTGPDRHAALADHAGLAALDVVHCVGPLMRRLHDALPPDRRGHWAEDAEAMARHLRDMVGAGRRGAGQGLALDADGRAGPRAARAG